MSSGAITSDSAKTQGNLPRNQQGNQQGDKNTKNNVANNQSENLSDFETLVDEVTTSVVTYSKKQPRVVAAGIFALGFIIGWKIKPW